MRTANSVLPSPLWGGIGSLRPPFLAPRTPMRSIGYAPTRSKGGRGGGRSCCARCVHRFLPPPPSPPQPKSGLPDFGHASAELGQARVRWGGEHTECAELAHNRC